MNSIAPSESDLVLVTGFGDKGVAELATLLNQPDSFRSVHIVAGVPWYRAWESAKRSSRRISQHIDDIPGDSKVLIGDSLGALMILVDSVRRGLRGILRLVLIDGPLRHDVDVLPCKPLHRLFYRQYNGRRELAALFPRKKRHLDLSRIVTMGTEEDRIVPPDAKRLDGVAHISLPYAGHSLRPKIVAPLIRKIL